MREVEAGGERKWEQLYDPVLIMWRERKASTFEMLMATFEDGDGDYNSIHMEMDLLDREKSASLAASLAANVGKLFGVSGSFNEAFENARRLPMLFSQEASDEIIADSGGEASEAR